MGVTRVDLVEQAGDKICHFVPLQGGMCRVDIVVLAHGAGIAARRVQ